MIYNGFGCQGQNISPQLLWKNAPQNTQSYALTLYDPDAPTGSGWWHWLIFNIDKNNDELKSNAGNIALNLAPKNSIQSITDFGKAGFGGACPPKGDKPHQYIFTIYALNVPKIDLSAQTNPAKVGFYLNRHTLAKASIIAYYGR